MMGRPPTFIATPESDAVIRAAYAVDRTRASIAAELGCSVRHVSYRAKLLGLSEVSRRGRVASARILELNTAPEHAAWRAERSRKARQRQMELIPVPVWAEKAGLAEKYISAARRNGEEYAARVCRKLKAQMVPA